MPTSAYSTSLLVSTSSTWSMTWWTLKRATAKRGFKLVGQLKIAGVNPSGIKLDLYSGKKAGPAPNAVSGGTGKRITASYCKKIFCEVNMAVYNREQVGSSFKPYILAAAVKQGMNVQTSTLNGFNNLYIAPDSKPDEYSTTANIAGSHQVHNDSLSENGPYTPQIAMAVSINTAYADLWHRAGGTAVANIAQTKIKAVGQTRDMYRLYVATAANLPQSTKDEFLASMSANRSARRSSRARS